MGIRYDSIALEELRPAYKTDEGYLHLDAVVTRTGVFPYKGPSGTTYEARPHKEVFDAESLESLVGKPVVLLHPREDSGEPVMVTPDNIADYQVGVVGMEVTELAGGRAKASLIVHRRDAIEAIEKGGIRELSPGYKTIHRTDGGTFGEPGDFEGARFDAVQTQIRYNHVALVPKGRQGAAVSLRLDDGDAIQILNKPGKGTPNKGSRMAAKVRIDNIEVEVVDASAATLITSVVVRRDAAISEAADATAKAEKAQARADELEGELTTLKAAQKSDEDVAAEFVAWANERAEITKGADALGVKVDDADTLDNGALRRAVVAGVEGVELKEDASDDFVRGTFNALVARPPARSSKLDAAYTPPSGVGDKPKSRMDAACESYADRMLNRNKTAANA